MSSLKSSKRETTSTSEAVKSSQVNEVNGAAFLSVNNEHVQRPLLDPKTTTQTDPEKEMSLKSPSSLSPFLGLPAI